MFGHLDIFSQQSHKSAPTDGRIIVLMCIIGPYGWPDYCVKSYHIIDISGA